MKHQQKAMQCYVIKRDNQILPKSIDVAYAVKV